MTSPLKDYAADGGTGCAHGCMPGECNVEGCMYGVALKPSTGPDELRKLAVHLRSFTANSEADACDTAADAWKAQEEEDTNIILSTSEQALELMSEVDALRKQLNAKPGQHYAEVCLLTKRIEDLRKRLEEAATGGKVTVWPAPTTLGDAFRPSTAPILKPLTPTPETHTRSILWMLAHDEWCSHDETDDGVECDCHLSAIASMRARIEVLESLRRTAQAFVDAPAKFGVRHKAYLHLCRALDGPAEEAE